MSSVEVRNIIKAYADLKVINDVSVAIPDGEFVVLVGPSGCGKSTLLRMIAGLEDISSGEIVIDGYVVNNVAPKNRDIAMVFQNYALYPHMTVRANMGFALSLKKADPAEVTRRIDSAASILGLTDLLDRFPRQLSGGQRQRVAMGRAIVRDPKVFLFDEPLSNLDAKLRVQMRAEIKALHQRLKTTTVYVTHDQVEAMTMADRIVVMRSGIVEQTGTPLELYDRPANAFVAQFIGSPAMNILTGRGRGDVFVTDDGVELPVHVSARHRLASATSYGVRPEHFALGGESGVPVTLEVVEPTGAETQLVVRLGGQMVVAAFRDRLDFRPGQTLSLLPDLNKVHLFDAQGDRLQ